MGQTEQGAKAVLKREGVTSTTSEQLEYAKKKATEESFARLFLYIADLHRYGKIIEDKENAVLHKRDPFFKTMSDACRLLNGWPNNEGIL